MKVCCVYLLAQSYYLTLITWYTVLMISVVFTACCFDYGVSGITITAGFEVDVLLNGMGSSGVCLWREI